MADTRITLDERELAMMLAGLSALHGMYAVANPVFMRRLLQRDFPEHFLNIVPLDGDEINALCERLNTP